LTDKPTYAYSIKADNPSECTLLCSTQEVDGWEEIGTVDRRFVQLIVTALNYLPTRHLNAIKAASSEENSI
jgi:hypothetical protein